MSPERPVSNTPGDPDAPESAHLAAEAPHETEAVLAGDRDAGLPVAHDPFEPHLRFASHTGMRLRPWMERPGPTPLEPIDTRADKLVDLDALEALASFRGLFKAPVEMHPDSYPSAVQDQMRQLEPQFVLRNLGRVERVDEGQGRLPMKRDRPAPGIDIDAVARLRLARYEPPTLLEETNLDFVTGLTAFRRHLVREVRWERHFSREIREDFEGPMWRYQPPEDAPQSALSADAAGGEASPRGVGADDGGVGVDTPTRTLAGEEDAAEEA